MTIDKIDMLINESFNKFTIEHKEFFLLHVILIKSCLAHLVDWCVDAVRNKQEGMVLSFGVYNFQQNKTLILNSTAKKQNKKAPESCFFPKFNRSVQ